MNRRKSHIIAQNGNSNSLFRRGLLAYVVSRSKYSKVSANEQTPSSDFTKAQPRLTITATPNRTIISDLG